MSNMFMSVLDFELLYASDGNNRSITCSEQISANQANMYLKSLFMEGANELNFVASCEEGCTTGNYYIGSICPKCKTEVRTNFAGELKYRAWLEIPEFMPPIIHPAVFGVLNKWLGRYNGKSLLNSLLTIGSDLPVEIESVMARGFTYFNNNFDDIMNFFLTQYKPLVTGVGKHRAVNIPEFLSNNRDKVFIRHLPVLNSSLHMITQSGAFKFSDTSSNYIIKALVELSNAAYGFINRPKAATYIDSQLKIVFDSYINYTDSIIAGNTAKKEAGKLASKEGFIRKYILGCRYHNSFRGVIVPITMEHTGDELHLPWRIGVSGLKLEIINILRNRYKYTLIEALAAQSKALVSYIPDVDKAMKILIRECPYKGLPVIFNRNPSLRHGALQLLFVNIIKSDIHDDTIGFSPLVLSAANADLNSALIMIN